MNKTITRDEFLLILSNYYSNKLRKAVDINYYTKVRYTNSGKKIDVFLYTSVKVRNENIMFYLNKNDIMNALNDYAYNSNCELIDFEYMTQFMETDHFFKESIPVFEGINLYIKEKAIKRL